MVASEYWPGSVKLGCAFIKHNYWYLLPSRIQSARLDFITSVPWKGIALCMCSHTHTHPLTLLPAHICIGRAQTHAYKQKSLWSLGTLRAKVVLGWEWGHLLKWKQKKKKNTHTHPSSPHCHVCPVCNEARGQSFGGGEGVSCVLAQLWDSPGPAQEWLTQGCVMKPAPYVPRAGNESDPRPAKSITRSTCRRRRKSVNFCVCVHTYHCWVIDGFRHFSESWSAKHRNEWSTR